MHREYDLGSLFATTPTIDDVSIKLDELGVHIRDATGEFRNLVDILGDITQKLRFAYDPHTNRILLESADTLLSFSKDGVIEENDEIDNTLDDFLSGFCITSCVQEVRV